jgi:imidazolonepropionase
MQVDALIEHCTLATMTSGDDDGCAVLVDGALAVRDGLIAWVGRRRDAAAIEPARRIDAGGRWITPGLIDCHTHLVYGGDRAAEFALRLRGASYEEIARAGGGIVATVAATRAADEEVLFEAASRRLATLERRGLTTVEIKSGYGLDVATELRMLAVARRLGATHAVRVVTTLLAAHALPAEYAGRSDDYVDEVCVPLVAEAARTGLADAIDAFGETIGFTAAQCARVFAAARAAGLPIKLHADQLSNQGGAALAASFGALSADHLEYSDDAGVAAMAAAGTVAVLLPGAFYCLRETRLPPLATLRAHGVPIALATDCNPGSSPVLSPLLTMNLGCTLFRLTPGEALAGFTVHAARALGLSDRIGRLAPGLAADLAFWDVDRIESLAYLIGDEPLAARWRDGRPVQTPSSRLGSNATSLAIAS